MAKKNKRFGSTPAGGSQMSKKERTEELIDKVRQEKEAAIMSDERVKAKVEEYEKLIAEAEAKLLEDEKLLKEKYELLELELEDKKKALSDSEAAIEKKKQELSDVEAAIKVERESARKEEIEKIRADEQAIREAERQELFATWEAEKEKQQKELEKYVRDKQKKVDAELEKAHTTRLEAEEQKLSKIHEADESIESKLAELTAEYEKKVKELAKLKAEYAEKLLEIEEERAEIEELKQYMAERRKRYEQSSEAKVLELQGQVEYYETVVKVHMERIKELSEKSAQMEGYMLDDNGQTLIARLNELEQQLADAKQKNDELANMPSTEEIERLRAKAVELESVRIALDDERQKREQAEAKMGAYAMGMRELENARASAAALESMNNQLQMRLEHISKQYKSTQESKFRVLLDIDKTVQAKGLFKATGFGKSLAELVEYIRNYGAYKKGLFYSEDTIRVFLASLAASEPASRLLILQGLSGTGKSSLPELIAEALGVEHRLVSVQPSWRDNRELLGYDNDFTNRFKETEFTKFLYEASARENQNKMYLIVLDEMNLARIEYYFADFLSVLEKANQDWIIPLVSGYRENDDDEKPKYLNYDNEAANICVTKNIWFVGTANNDDSTSLITDKVYDRAQVLDMDERAESFKGKRVAQISMDMAEIMMLFAEAKSGDNLLTDSDMQNIETIDEYLRELDITFGNRIEKQMKDFVPVYVACGGTKEDAIDYLLTHKILRKLDERYEPYLVTKLEELEMALNETYGEGKFKQSIDKIQKLKTKIAG